MKIPKPVNEMKPEHKLTIKTALESNWSADEVSQVLGQAEPYIEKMAGKAMVIKCSGSVLSDSATQQNFARDIVCLKSVGIKPIVVHGGGHQITQTLEEQGVKSKFYKGLRITDAKTMSVVIDVVLAINQELKSQIANYSADAVSNHYDGKYSQCKFVHAVQLSKKLGYVGKVVEINDQELFTELNNGEIPVIPSLGQDVKNQELLNINADTVASTIAVAIGAERLHILSNVNGIYADFENIGVGSEIESVLTIPALKEMLKSGAITTGMIPKVEACLYALERGLNAAHILNGTFSNNLILELFTDTGIGTMLVNESLKVDEGENEH